ncbi:hypothetical protein ILUMI_22523 [Ignelater luminosus]|uniref:Uncharacterized protein n=1 Tax=Ignelater luminosus TaxID=2038154 RepID=A0A8K0G2J0_IGNLU|nr:hypothetical protein ILUMI_22523 [Ignelater luminosus]
MCYKSSTSNMKRHIQRKHPTVNLAREDRDREVHNSNTDEDRNITRTPSTVQQDTNDTRHNDTNTTTSQHDSQSSTSTSTIDKSKFARPRQTTVTTFYAKNRFHLI